MLTGYIAREDETPIAHTFPRRIWQCIARSLRDVEGYARISYGKAPPDVSNARWCIEAMLHLHDHKAERSAQASRLVDAIDNGKVLED